MAGLFESRGFSFWTKTTEISHLRNINYSLSHQGSCKEMRSA